MTPRRGKAAASLDAPGAPEPRFLAVITALFVASLLLANAVSAKILAIGPLAIPAGTIIFPLSFVFGDVLTEVYGYSRSRRVIWIGSACQVLAALVYLLVGWLPGAPYWRQQTAYDAILGFVPRIVAASVTACWCGEFCNCWVLSKMKYLAGGRRGWKQALRFVASTAAGQAVDSVIFMAIGYTGQVPADQLIPIGATMYAVKIAWEFLALPISMRLANWMKEAEGIDFIDRPEFTKYSPFAQL